MADVDPATLAMIQKLQREDLEESGALEEWRESTRRSDDDDYCPGPAKRAKKRKQVAAKKETKKEQEKEIVPAAAVPIEPIPAPDAADDDPTCSDTESDGGNGHTAHGKENFFTAAVPTKKKGTSVARGLTLRALMKEGLMEPGQGVLRVEYKGHVFLGDLTPSGSICYEGELWESPSSWSIHVKRRVFPDKKADDGWKSVFYVTEDGEKTKLEQLRRTHALKMFGFGSFEKETATAPKAKPEFAARAPAAEPAAPAEPTEYAKQRPKRELKKRHWLEHDLEGHEMVPMELFCGSPGSGEEGSQPFGVQVSCGCQVVMDVHGFMSFSKEIIGLLGGRVERTQGGRPVVRVEEAFPVREIRTEDDTINVEMDPESEVEVRAKMADAGLIAVGWYHSHPSFPAVPSVIDLTNQLRYQRLVREEDGLEPWIAAIVSPYNKTRPAMESELTYFYVDAGARTGGKDAELDRDCRSMALDTATSENMAFAAAAMSKIKMIKEWYGAEWEGASLWEGQTTLKDKLLHSVSSRLPSCWSDAMREAFLNSLNHLLV